MFVSFRMVLCELRFYYSFSELRSSKSGSSESSTAMIGSKTLVNLEKGFLHPGAYPGFFKGGGGVSHCVKVRVLTRLSCYFRLF